MNFVLDASVTLCWLLGDAGSADLKVAHTALDAPKGESRDVQGAGGAASGRRGLSAPLW